MGGSWADDDALKRPGRNMKVLLVVVAVAAWAMAVTLWLAWEFAKDSLRDDYPTGNAFRSAAAAPGRADN